MNDTIIQFLKDREAEITASIVGTQNSLNQQYAVLGEVQRTLAEAEKIAGEGGTITLDQPVVTSGNNDYIRE